VKSPGLNFLICERGLWLHFLLRVEGTKIHLVSSKYPIRQLIILSGLQQSRSLNPSVTINVIGKLQALDSLAREVRGVGGK
jgi:hypothetical protein